MRDFIYYIIPIAIFTCFFHLATPNGVQTYTFDSQEYRNAAISFSKDQKLRERGNKPYRHYAPLYPVVLSFFMDDLSSNVKIVHWFLWSITLAGWLYYARFNISDTHVSWCTAILICGSVYSIVLARNLWSETLFVTFFSGFLYCYWRLDRSHSKITFFLSLLMAFVFGAVMVLTRFAGMVLIVYVLLWQFLKWRKGKSWFRFLPLLGIITVHLVNQVYVNKKLPTGTLSQLSLSERGMQFTERVVWYYNQFLDYFCPLLPIEGLYGVLFTVIIFLLGLYVGLIQYNKAGAMFQLSFFYLHFILLLIFIKDFGTYEDTSRFMDVMAMVFYLFFVLTLERFFKVVNLDRRWFLLIMYVMVILNISRTTYNVLRWNAVL